jgi:hypothetical protein
MKRRAFTASVFVLGVGFPFPSKSAGQNRQVNVDLSRLSQGKGLRVFNRSVVPISDGTRRGIRLSEAQGEGLAYLEGIEFGDGLIEVDIRGKDVQQESFVGVAFHGVDGTTYDAVYFRPFNFRAVDPARRVRAVQYISSPGYKWQRLRSEYPGKYENAVNPVPDPNGWFHARIAVVSPKVTVFVNDGMKPSLVVSKLNERGKGLAGLWVDNFGGDFANLRVVPA